MLELLTKLGITGYPLFICVFAFLIVSSERAWFLFSESSSGKGKLCIIAKKFPRIGKLVVKHSGKTEDKYLSFLQKILMDNSKMKKEIREEIVGHELEKVRKEFCRGLGVVKFCSVVGPMLGLLGTILGMISIFGAIAQSSASITPSIIASGLEEAMYTTAFGLFIAIPAMACYAGLNHIIDAKIDHYIEVLNAENIIIDTEPQYGKKKEKKERKSKKVTEENDTPEET